MLRSGLSDTSTLYAPIALDPLVKRVSGSSTNTALLHFDLFTLLCTLLLYSSCLLIQKRAVKVKQNSAVS